MVPELFCLFPKLTIFSSLPLPSSVAKIHNKSLTTFLRTKLRSAYLNCYEISLTFKMSLRQGTLDVRTFVRMVLKEIANTSLAPLHGTSPFDRKTLGRPTFSRLKGTCRPIDHWSKWQDPFLVDEIVLSAKCLSTKRRGAPFYINGCLRLEEVKGK